MITRAELASNKKLAHDRAFGALIGLAIGDSFGDAARTPENHLKYGILMDFDEKESPSTDDTEFALLTANILVEGTGNPTIDHVVDNWLLHVVTQDDFPRGGASEIEAAANLRRGLRPPLSGQYNSHHLSDGAAMRTAPNGIVAAGDPARAAKMAALDASISHWRDGIWGAQAVAAGVATAMVGGSADEVFRAALSVVPEDSWLFYTMKKTEEIVRTLPLTTAWMKLHTELWTTYKAAVPEAVAQAFGAFLLAEGDFHKGVIYAGNFGRDADTIGAVVGALCGARAGASAIPASWVEKTRYPSGTCLQFTKGLDVADIAGQLAEFIR